MDQETREKVVADPKQDGPEQDRKGGKKPFQGLRNALRRAYLRTEPARRKFIERRNKFCRTLRSAFDDVAAFFLKIWAVIGPVCRKIAHVCKVVAHAIAVAAKAFWKVAGPFFKKLWALMKPGFLFLGDKIKQGFAYLAARFKGLNKAMQIGIGAVSGSLVLLIIALMVSASVSRSAMKLVESTPDANTLPVVEETAAPTKVPATPTPVPEPMQGDVLKKGDDSPTIVLVQTRLMELGYMDSDEPTEHFGGITAAALTRFQQHNDLKADGQLGEDTWLLLMNEGVEFCVLQEGDEGDDVTDVQNRLYELGYLSKSSITGTFGEKTKAAVVEFQKANALVDSGRVDHDTVDALYSDEVVGNFYTKGEVSDTIAAYQQKLKKLGYLAIDYKVKGKMDNDTINAIRKFQDNNDLTPDGCLGPTTMSAIDSKNAKSYTLKLGMKGSDVKAVQKRLKELGYLHTNSQVTGYFGDATERAVEEFQRRNGLSADGTVGPKTLEKLNSSSARKAKPTPSPTPKATAKPKVTAKATAKSGSSTKTTKPGGNSGSGSSSSGSSSTSTNKTGVEKLISIAESKIGCPYSGGAKGPNKFDCSGFVYWCMKQAGFSGGYMNSRAWRTCSRYPRITSMSDIKRGDVLVFRGDSADTGHVGIYLGSGKMIDASSSAGKVRITTTVTSGSYWKNHFLMAYRIYN